MCITVESAAMSNTFITAFNFGRNSRLVYQNETTTTGNNAMILAIPGEINNIEALPKGWASSLFEKINPFKARGYEQPLLRIGSYDIFVCNDFHNIKVISFLEGNNIKMSDKLKNWFHNNYKSWSFIICAFNPNNDGEMHPIAIDYYTFPWLKDIAFIPLVEGHDGDVPNKDLIRPHQKVMVNGVIILNDSPLKHENGDLYVSRDAVLSYYEPYENNLLYWEQNPKDLPFYEFIQ